MSSLTPEGQTVAAEIAARHGVSPGAVETLMIALVNGGGTQAQFSHPDLGGMGQWSLGGMTMVGDMFNNGLKAQVDSLCTELSQRLAQDRTLLRSAAAPFSSQTQSQSQGSGGTSLFLSGMGGSSWPSELGAPSSSGSQNNLRYAVFPGTRRLAIDIHGRTEIFDTLDHVITGVSQQQSGDQSLTFTSQNGLVRLADLPRVSSGDSLGAGSEPSLTSDTSSPVPRSEPEAVASEMPSAPVETASPVSQSLHETPSAPLSVSPSRPQPAEDQSDAIIALIRKLADLRDAGILTDDEFQTKKTDLLGRL